MINRLRILINGQARSDCWFDPAYIRYVGGCVVPLSHIANLLGQLVDICYVEAIKMADKFMLEQAQLDLAQQAGRGRGDA